MDFIVTQKLSIHTFTKSCPTFTISFIILTLEIKLNVGLREKWYDFVSYNEIKITYLEVLTAKNEHFCNL